MTPPDDQGWQRFHPLSPLLKGGVFLVAVVGYLLNRLLGDLAGSLGLGGGDEDPDVPASGGRSVELSPFDHPLLAVGGVGAVLLAILAVGAASWWLTRYRLGERTIELRSGALYRQHRQVPFDRVQAVSIARPLLGRLLGLSEVKVESAGGGDSHLRLAYLSQSDAIALRDRIVALADVDDDRPAAATTDEGGEGDLLVAMPLARLVGSTLLSVAGIFLALMLPLAVVLVLVGLGAAVAGLGAPLLFAALDRGRHLLTWTNLTVRRRGGSLRVSHGLTDLAAWSLPLRRVQAFEVRQPLLWRRAAWWRTSVNVAGVKIGGEQVGGDGVLVPAGTTQETAALVAALTSDDHTQEVYRGMWGDLPDGAFRSPPSARWLDPVSWRRNGVVVDEQVLLLRRGRLGRTVQVVPHGRIQSVTLAQGPLQRRLGLAELRIISTVGAVEPVSPPLRRADVEALLALESRLAGAARTGRMSTPSCTSPADSVNLSTMHTLDADDDNTKGPDQ